jgi:hypothetical protein
VLGPERDDRIHDDGVTGIELEPVLAHDHREEDLRLHHGEVIPHARTRPAAER